MLYSYGSFLSKMTISLTSMMMPVPHMSINPSKTERSASHLNMAPQFYCLVIVTRRTVFELVY